MASGSRFRVHREHLLGLALRVHGLHRRARCAAQPLVVALLEPGQAGLVPGPVGAVRLLDDLRGHGADRAEHRAGELAGGREREGVADDPTAGDVAGRLVRRLRLGRPGPVHERLDERLRAGGAGPVGVRRGVDVEGPGEGPRRRHHLGVRDLGLVDADPDHRPGGDEGGAAGAGDVGALRRDAGQPQRPALGEIGVDEVGVELHPPGAAVCRPGQSGRGAVGPRLAAARQPPHVGQRRLGGLPVGTPGDLGDLDPRLGVPEPPGGRGPEPLGLAGRAAGEREGGELAGRERRGELARGVLGGLAVGTAGAAGHRQDQSHRCGEASGGQAPRVSHARIAPCVTGAGQKQIAGRGPMSSRNGRGRYP